MTATWLLACLIFPPVGADTPAGDALVLFNGKDLTGWKVEGPADFKDGAKTLPIWVVHEGNLRCQVNKGSFGFLRYASREFADFQLSLEYRFAPPAGPKARKGNSGIGICTVAYDPKRSVATRPSYAAYEIQLLDDADQKPSKHSTASLYRYVAPSEQAAKAAPEWNKLEVVCIGPRIKIVLNGKTVVDVDQTTIEAIKSKPLRGHVCLQNHGSVIDFRNIRVRPLGSGDRTK